MGIQRKTDPEPGDEVSWNSSSGPVTGKVVKKVTSTMRIKVHAVAASPEEPQFIVQSAKTGAKAAHKSRALEMKR